MNRPGDVDAAAAGGIARLAAAQLGVRAQARNAGGAVERRAEGQGNDTGHARLPGAGCPHWPRPLAGLKDKDSAWEEGRETGQSATRQDPGSGNDSKMRQSITEVAGPVS
ncbi:hypothetical protein D3C86_1940210 [compost metagenome]